MQDIAYHAASLVPSNPPTDDAELMDKKYDTTQLEGLGGVAWFHKHLSGLKCLVFKSHIHRYSVAVSKLT